MSDKLQGGIKAGSTSVSVSVILRKTADTTEQTGTVASGVTAYYWRQGGTPTALTAASDLASITSAFAAGGWKEADSTHLKGVYRLDVDNAAFATGADWVVIGVTVTGCFVFVERYNLTTNVVQSGDAYANEGVAGANLTAIPTIANVTLVGTTTNLTNLPAIPSNWITAAGITAGAFNGKGDWLLASSAPTNFSSLLISAGGHISNVDTLTTYTGNTLQTGDSYARLGAPAGASIAADLAEIEGETDGIAAIPTTNPTAVQIADTVLTRDFIATTTAVGQPARRSLMNAARKLVNHIDTTTTGGSLTVTQEDDNTAAYTQVIVVSASAELMTAVG